MSNKYGKYSRRKTAFSNLYKLNAVAVHGNIMQFSTSLETLPLLGMCNNVLQSFIYFDYDADLQQTEKGSK